MRWTLLVLTCAASQGETREKRSQEASCLEAVNEIGIPAKSVLMTGASLHPNNAEEHMRPRSPSGFSLADAHHATQRANFTADMESFLEAESRKLRIFCFAWTPRLQSDEKIIPYVRRLLSGCDGHAFFTDTDAPGDDKAGDFVRVKVPQMRLRRNEEWWMKNKNMAGLAPAWAHMFKTGVHTSYDWAINLELDHFAPAPRIRRSIIDYLEVLRLASEEDKRSVDGPLLFAWGNAFVFNSQFMMAMEEKWPEIGKPILDETNSGQGCPMLLLDRARELGACQQDLAYPLLPDLLFKPPQKMYGMSGCNMASEHPPFFPRACWQPPLVAEDTQLAVLKEMSNLRRFPTKHQARKYCDSRGSTVAELCDQLYESRNVPVMHFFKTEAMHKKAAELFLH